eukprot:NODE_5533_length_574_cov_275.001927.p1 GENE.NODE_5533_length_574_cov_275.001927~~NODE_5533_length_574_cov_275.001927.p1  ORF type:complete len:130 (+),score=24.84 NODE_5533_length_574_cov_275.001927:35-391(+)
MVLVHTAPLDSSVHPMTASASAIAPRAASAQWSFSTACHSPFMSEWHALTQREVRRLEPRCIRAGKVVTLLATSLTAGPVTSNLNAAGTHLGGVIGETPRNRCPSSLKTKLPGAVSAG